MQENLVQNVQVGEHIATRDHILIRGEIDLANELDVINEQMYSYRSGKFDRISGKIRRIDWNKLYSHRNVSDMYDISKIYS